MVDQKLQKKINDGVDKLRFRWNIINHLLYDAEENWVIEKKATKYWLYQLKLFAAKAEDLIEEYNYQHVQGQQEHSTISTSFLNYILKNLNEMEADFENINKERELDLSKNDFEKKTYVQLRPPSNPLNEEHLMYGRDEDMKHIVDMLIQPNDQQNQEETNVTIINIVGMGGVGKTSIAQEIYKDENISSYFDCKAWVCVSDDFQIDKISKDTLISLTGEGCDLTVFSVIQEELQNELEGKVFLLVLDDVWSEIQHVSDTLGFLHNLGSPGSKILVTTRSKVVARTMYRSLDFNLGPLQFNFGWELFRNHALYGSVHENNQVLTCIGRMIVEKCKGLPLIIKVLGNLLRDANGDEERWREVLAKNTMEIMGKNGENTIFETLNLSYINLPTSLKRCFLYCSVFPKDHLFSRDDLVHLWGAHGILEYIPLGECVDGLFNRSFLQTKYDNFGELKYVLHDLMHDLAQHILREENLLISNESCGIIQDKFCCIEPIAGRTFHHSLYPSPNQIEIESLHLSLKYLRVFIWANDVATHIPDSIGELKHLRFLKLDTPNVECLPESVCNLYNLQTLHCDWLVELPENIRKLRNLLHIICVNFVYIPVGFGELIQLQTLPKLSMSNEEEGCGGLSELENLSKLSGSLALNEIEHEYLSEEKNTIKLFEKQYLRELNLTWKFISESYVSEINVLNNLRPCNNLVKLEISFYCGLKFPDWMGCSEFAMLTHVALDHCFSCEILPPLGQLVSLKELNIYYLKNIKRIGAEFYNGGNSVENPPNSSFISLEKLFFNHMGNWVEWCEIDQCSFPSLTTLEIWNCHNLRLSYIPRMFTKLESLNIYDSPHIIKMCIPHINTTLSAIKSIHW